MKMTFRARLPREEWEAMIPRSLILALILSLQALTSCSGKCSSTSDCDRGEHCDFVAAKCIAGCKSNADCSRESRCDSQYGICRLTGPGVRRDSGTSTTTMDASDLDARTSTRADAGLRD